MNCNHSEPDLEDARMIVEDPLASLSAVRVAAWRLFEANQFEAARRGFERLVVADPGDADVITALQQLYSDRDDLAAVARLIDQYLAERGPDLSPDRRLTWTTALFDAVVAAAAAPDRSQVTLQLLEAAAAAGAGGWQVVLDPDRRVTIDAALHDRHVGLDALEQFTYAPIETGLPAEAIARIEEIGRRHATDRDLARSAERLLHALGQPEAAYRIEAGRRAATRRSPHPASIPRTKSPPSLAGLVVAIAGGHPALRAMARRDLSTAGAAGVKEIPSAWEATRDGRSVQATLSGSHVVVVIARQIAHTTSDQVRRAAQRLGIPVETADSASLGAIRRSVERFARAVRIE